MDLVTWVEAHLAFIAAAVGVAASAVSLYVATVRRSSDVTSSLRLLEGKLDAHAIATEAGFRGINRRLDTLNGKVFSHERDIGELRGHVERAKLS